jgi:dienelactone hydrolase
MNMWQPDAFLERMYEETMKRNAASAAAESREERNARLLNKLRDAIGTFSASVAEHQGVRVLERTDCGSYIRERVELCGVEGLRFAAYVLIPKGAGAPLPAMLAIHGHGYGSREIVGLSPDGSPDTGVPSCHNHFALQLVARGLLVLAPDVVGFGERMLEEDRLNNPGGSSCYKLATQMLLYGKTLTGLRTAELLAALDYLASRDDVDTSRIGTMGFSGGALLAWVCAALDQRLKAVVLTGFPGTFKGTIMTVHHCVDNFTPGLLAEAELPEWIGLIAPRALFAESAERDPIFPTASAQEACRQLELLYQEAGAAERFAWDVFPGVHEVSGRRAFDWLAEQLLLR